MRLLRRTALLLFMVAGLLLLAMTALADHLEVEVVQPVEVDVGESVRLTVRVRSAETGERVPGAVVVASKSAEIGGFSGQVEVARAVSDENGIADLVWLERGDSTETVVVAYSAPGESGLESHPLEVITVGPGPQLEGGQEGFRIPGLGVWVLIFVLVGIWAIIQFALAGPLQVAAKAEEAAVATRTEAGSDAP